MTKSTYTSPSVAIPAGGSGQLLGGLTPPSHTPVWCQGAPAWYLAYQRTYSSSWPVSRRLYRSVACVAAFRPSAVNCIDAAPQLRDGLSETSAMPPAFL